MILGPGPLLRLATYATDRRRTYGRRRQFDWQPQCNRLAEMSRLRMTCYVSSVGRAQ